MLGEVSCNAGVVSHALIATIKLEFQGDENLYVHCTLTVAGPAETLRKNPMKPYLPLWKQALVGFVQNVLQESIAELQSLVEGRQLNRRSRAAWKQGRTQRALFLSAHHHQRRLQRRREIRQLVEGPVRKNV